MSGCVLLSAERLPLLTPSHCIWAKDNDFPHYEAAKALSVMRPYPFLLWPQLCRYNPLERGKEQTEIDGIRVTDGFIQRYDRCGRMVSIKTSIMIFPPIRRCICWTVSRRCECVRLLSIFHPAENFGHTGFSSMPLLY